MYSYKEPRKKHILDSTTKMWLVFLSTILAGLFAYGIYLYKKSSTFNEELVSIQNQNKLLSNSVNSLNKELRELKRQKILSIEVAKSNKLVSNSIKNLFNLVPDQIVLSKVFMEKDQLRLEGISSTKDAYRLLLEPPLKSIFEESSVKFEFDPRLGRYRFVSVNKAQTVSNKNGSEDGKK